MQEDGHVLVIGSAGVDVKGRPWDAVNWGAPNLGYIRNSVGGVARNIAENLARLEIPTILLTAVGEDTAGDRVLDACDAVDIQVDYVRQIPDGRTGTYMAVLQPDGQLHVAISDFEIMSHVNSEYVREHEDLLRFAEMIVIDATLSEETLQTIFELATRYDVPVAADPTTPVLAGRLCPYIDQLYLIVPNASETTSLCKVNGPAEDRETGTEVARTLVTMGAKVAVVTMGELGLSYAHGSGGGFIRAVHTNVVDTTGAGDAFSGGVIFGLLNDVPLDEAMRLGITAASLTLESQFTVLPELSQELLYDKLTV